MRQHPEPPAACDDPSPVEWNDGYTPRCQLPPAHEGVDHWAMTPAGPCVWAADGVHALTTPFGEFR